jgi:hypothetical protein
MKAAAKDLRFNSKGLLDGVDRGYGDFAWASAFNRK